MGTTVSSSKNPQEYELPKCFEELEAQVRDANVISRKILGRVEGSFDIVIKNGKTLENPQKPGLWLSTVLVRSVRNIPPDEQDGSSKRTERFLTPSEFVNFYAQLVELERAEVQDGTEKRATDSTNEEYGGTDASFCMVCMEKRYNVLLPCGHRVCDICIDDWRKRSNTCPFCRRTIASSATNDEDWVITEAISEEDLKSSLRGVGGESGKFKIEYTISGGFGSVGIDQEGTWKKINEEEKELTREKIIDWSYTAIDEERDDKSIREEQLVYSLKKSPDVEYRPNVYTLYTEESSVSMGRLPGNARLVLYRVLDKIIEHEGLSSETHWCISNVIAEDFDLWEEETETKDEDRIKAARFSYTISRNSEPQNVEECSLQMNFDRKTYVIGHSKTELAGNK